MTRRMTDEEVVALLLDELLGLPRPFFAELPQVSLSRTSNSRLSGIEVE